MTDEELRRYCQGKSDALLEMAEVLRKAKPTPDANYVDLKYVLGLFDGLEIGFKERAKEARMHGTICFCGAPATHYTIDGFDSEFICENHPNCKKKVAHG